MRRVCFLFARHKKTICPHPLNNYGSKVMPRELGGLEHRFRDMPEINMPLSERQKRFSEVVEEMKVKEQDSKRESCNIGVEFDGVKKSDQVVRGPRQKRRLGERYKVRLVRLNWC